MCKQACASGLAQLIAAGGSDKAQCGCLNDDSCALVDGATHCGPAGTCVACTLDSQCSGDKPFCGASSECVACKTNQDCAGATPYCLTAGGRCVSGCSANSDCAEGKSCMLDADSPSALACLGCNDGIMMCLDYSNGVATTCSPSEAGRVTCGAPATSSCAATDACLMRSPVECVNDPSCCGSGKFPAAVCRRKCAFDHGDNLSVSSCQQDCPSC
jgi:hypothetical protein